MIQISGLGSTRYGSLKSTGLVMGRSKPASGAPRWSSSCP